MAMTGAAGREDATVVADMPLFDITSTDLTPRLWAMLLTASAIASQIGIGGRVSAFSPVA